MNFTSTPQIKSPSFNMPFPNQSQSINTNPFIVFLYYVLIVISIAVISVGGFIYLAEKFDFIKDLETAIRRAFGVARVGGDEIINTVDEKLGKTVNIAGAGLNASINKLDELVSSASANNGGRVPTNGPGYCKIGNENGVAKCAYVFSGEQCMSGKIFDDEWECSRNMTE